MPHPAPEFLHQKTKAGVTTMQIDTLLTATTTHLQTSNGHNWNGKLIAHLCLLFGLLNET
jgi:hypothetical protein